MRSVWSLGLVLMHGCSSADSSNGARNEGDSAAVDGDFDTATDATGDTGASDALDFGATGKTARLRVHYPAGSQKITLRGSSAGWSWTKGVAMTAGSDDTWTLETDAVTVATEWKPLLDDATWSRGPNYHVEPGQTVDVFPHFITAKGTFEKKWTFHSTTLGNDRGIWVYLPPTYLENTRAKLPVIYMHDGQNLFDAAIAFGGNEWKVDETMDAAAEDGSIREAIVIGVENTSARMSEYTPTKDATYGGGNGDAYLQMLVSELKPKVDAELRTLPSREDTAMLGSSLGGLISAYGGTTRSSTFALIGALSPSTWWDGTVILADVAATKGKTPRPLRVYVDSGDAGASNDDVLNTAKLAQKYRDVGFVDAVDLDYVVQKGATHSEVYWAQRLPGALRFLMGPRP